MNDEELDIQEAVAPAPVDEASFDERLRELARLDAESERLDAELSDINRRKDVLSWSLANYMLATGCSKKVLDNITFTQKQRIYSKVEDKVALREWIEKNNAVDLLMAVHPSKLTAYCNEQLEAGGETPAGVNPNFIKYYVHVK